MNNNEYLRLSLELHLFFDRIMKEHSFFLEAAFTEKDNNLKTTSRNFQKSFSDILKRVISLSEGRVTNNLLSSNEIVTKNTLDAETKTSNLSAIPIDTNITKKELTLRSGNININDEVLNTISSINKQTLPIIKNLIKLLNGANFQRTNIIALAKIQFIIIIGYGYSSRLLNGFKIKYHKIGCPSILDI